MKCRLISKMRTMALGGVLLFLHPSGLQAERFLEWNCGGTFIGCSPDPQNPIQLSIDNTKNPSTYQANGLAVEALGQTPPQPFAKNSFSFAFDTGIGNFALVIDLTSMTNIQSSFVTSVQTEPSPFTPGLTTLSFEMYYKAGALPTEYSDYLGTKTAWGFVQLDYDPNADDKGRKNVITYIQVDIAPSPEPVGGLLAGSALALLVLVGRARRQSDPRASRPT